MTLDHKCQIFQNLNGAVGETSQKLNSIIQFTANLCNFVKYFKLSYLKHQVHADSQMKKKMKTRALNNFCCTNLNQHRTVLLPHSVNDCILSENL